MCHGRNFFLFPSFEVSFMPWSTRSRTQAFVESWVFFQFFFFLIQLMLIRHYIEKWLFCVDTFTIHKKFSVKSLGSNRIDLTELNNLSLNNIFLSLESIRNWGLYVQAELKIQYLSRFENVVPYHCTSDKIECPSKWCLRLLAATAKITES